ncbi:MAG: hypothetical protein PVF70_06915 [Anaerolineales bacterium]|jgi:hypothetical protein
MNFFPLLIFNARPAAGKSEISAYVRQVPVEERIARFHMGPIHVLDDFPILWTWHEEDRLLELIFQRPRLHTTPDRYFIHHDMWHLLIRRLCLDYGKWRRDEEEAHTAIMEFSRGSEHGGYRAAYEHLSATVLRQAAILYLRVSYQESQRKNRARFNPARPGSILEHGLPEAKLERLYRDDDWEEFTAGDPEYVNVGKWRLPYVVFENEDDVTTAGGPEMEERLEKAMARLWHLWQERRST